MLRLKNHTYLIAGARGLLGQAIVRTLEARGHTFITLGKENCDINIDLTANDFHDALTEAPKFDTLINCAAIVDLKLCEENPRLAEQTNSLIPLQLSNFSKSRGAYFLQISTDHYFEGDGRKKHDELAEVICLNKYAETKRQGEIFTLNNSDALVVRTNIVGIRNAKKFTFLEWALDMLKSRAEISAFEDFFTSSISALTLSEILIEICSQRPSGILNIASSQVSSKYEFIECLAKNLGISDPLLRRSSVKNLEGPKRANSLGLDVSKCEKLLQLDLPDLESVVRSLIVGYKL